MVATGPGFRPGEGDAQDKGIAEIAGWICDTFGLEPETGWTNEDFMPMDGLPYVGAATGSTPNLLVATGFNAWGITNGVVAAQILADTIQSRDHSLAAVYDVTRLRSLKGATTLLSENAKAGFRMARDRILRSKVESLEAIEAG
jgi:glycine/D-amino acid oxidase-like deaminating enzyme